MFVNAACIQESEWSLNDNCLIKYKRYTIRSQHLSFTNISMCCRIWTCANWPPKVWHRPVARAVRSLTLTIGFVTAKRKICPKQFSHGQLSFFTAATVFALLSVMMQTSFFSSRCAAESCSFVRCVQFWGINTVLRQCDLRVQSVEKSYWPLTTCQ